MIHLANKTSVRLTGGIPLQQKRKNRIQSEDNAQKMLKIVAIFCISLWLISTFHRDAVMHLTTIEGQDGVWDLRDKDITEQLLLLEGDVQYIEGALVSPEAFDSRADAVSLGKPSPDAALCTAKLVLLMPDDESYALRLEGDVARQVFVNGERLGSNGTPGLTAAETEVGYENILVRAEAVDGRLEILIQSANFINTNISSYSCVYVGTEENVDWYFDLDFEVRLLIIGMLFMLFCFHIIVVFAFDGSPANLICAILCMTWSLRFGVYDGGYFYSIVPSLSWEVGFRIEHLCVPLSGLLVVDLIRRQFPDAIHRYVVPVVGAAIILFCGYISFASTALISSLFEWASGLYIAAVIYLALALLLWQLKRHRQKRLRKSDVLASIPVFVLFFATVHDSLWQMGVNLFWIPHRINEPAGLYFAICETVILITFSLRRIRTIEMEKNENRVRLEELNKYIEMKTRFMSMVAHELKTPLAIVMGGADESLDILRDMPKTAHATAEDCGPVSEIARNQQVIIDTVKQLGESVSDLLDTSAIELGRLSLQLDRLDLRELTRQVGEQFRIQLKRTGNKLQFDFPFQLNQIEADDKRIQQVLTNILSNAIRHTQNGVITIRIQEEENWQWIDISDTGIGISAAAVQNFSQNKFIDGGNHMHRGGIGLYVCQEIIHSHDGVFTIERNPDVGTKVTIGLRKMRKEGASV